MGRRCSFERLYNPRLHLTAPRERFQMQPAVNGCSVLGIVTGPAHCARAGWLGVVHRGLSGRAAPQVSRRPLAGREQFSV